MFYCRRKSVAKSAAKKSQIGFTLVELMITLAIAGVLLSLAGPNFNSLIENSRISGARDSLANSIKLARSEAVFNKSPVTICASSNQATCTGGTDWKDGWIIFNDTANPGVVDAGEALADINYGNPNVSITGVSSVTFLASGMRAQGSAARTFSVCDAGGDTSIEGKGVTVNIVGSISYEGDATSGCP